MSDRARLLYYQERLAQIDKEFVGIMGEKAATLDAIAYLQKRLEEYDSQIERKSNERSEVFVKFANLDTRLQLKAELESGRNKNN